jgi:hypothetical protein
MDWIKWAGILAGVVVAGALAIEDLSAWHWNKMTRALIANLYNTKAAEEDTPYTEFELANLPAPVQRYFRVALKEGQPIIKSARFSHAGTFNMSTDKSSWKPFTSNQEVVVNRPGFIWDARVQMFPAISVYVHDVYVAGEGSLQASILGLFDVANMSGSEAMAQGELLRFLAETPLYPTALLPRNGISWTAIDGQSAQVSLADKDLQVTMTFTFNQSGLIDTVWAAARSRVNGKIFEYMPWQGRFWNYVERNGMMVPLEAEVAWLPPDGAKPYYRSKLTSISFDF